MPCLFNDSWDLESLLKLNELAVVVWCHISDDCIVSAEPFPRYHNSLDVCGKIIWASASTLTADHFDSQLHTNACTYFTNFLIIVQNHRYNTHLHTCLFSQTLARVLIVFISCSVDRLLCQHGRFCTVCISHQMMRFLELALSLQHERSPSPHIRARVHRICKVYGIHSPCTPRVCVLRAIGHVNTRCTLMILHTLER